MSHTATGVWWLSRRTMVKFCPIKAKEKLKHHHKLKKLNFIQTTINMKLALATLAAVATAEPIPDTNSQFVAFNQGARQAKQEIAAGVRSDGNALLISQMLEFYLIQVHGITPDKVEMMLSYGCYCQLLTNRRVGLDEPVDEFDA